MYSLFSFVKRFFIFLIPLFLCLSAYEYAMYRTGESWPVALVAQKQIKIPEILYGRKFFSHNFFHYKKRVLEKSTADIVVLGSSRVMQIREFMFSPLNDSFYNFGGMVRNVNELQTYCNLIISGKVYKPRVLIVGVDPWWFNKNQIQTDRHNDWRGFDWLPDLSDHFTIGLDLLRGVKKIPFNTIIGGVGSKSPYYGYYSIGLSAIQEGSGFRIDGSRQYSPKIVSDFICNPVYVDRESPPVIYRVKNNKNFFTIPESHSIDILVKALEMLERSGVEVYAIFPAFSNEVVEVFMQDQSLRKAWEMYLSQLPGRLEKAEISCYSDVCPALFGLEDEYMFDGMHPSEVLMAHQILKIIKTAPEDSYLGGVDVQKLERLIHNPEKNPLSFDRIVSRKCVEK